MPKLDISVDHALPQQEAIDRIKNLMPKIQAKYKDMVKDIEDNWVDDSTLKFAFRTMGMNIDGVVKVLADKVDLQGSVPFAAMMFKGKIEAGIREELQKLLA